jgi:hypothetical protein
MYASQVASGDSCPSALLQPRPRSIRVSACYDRIDVRVREPCRGSTVLPRCVHADAKAVRCLARWQVRLTDQRWGRVVECPVPSGDPRRAQLVHRAHRRPRIAGAPPSKVCSLGRQKTRLGAFIRGQWNPVRFRREIAFNRSRTDVPYRRAGWVSGTEFATTCSRLPDPHSRNLFTISRFWAFGATLP